MFRFSMNRFVGCLGTPTLLFFAATGCSSVSAEPSERAGADDEQVQSSTEAVTIGADTICSAINSATSVVLKGSPVSATFACGDDVDTSVSYLGSAAPASFSTASSARHEAEAIYCTVSAANQHHANAFVDTNFGKFGASGLVQITNADPANLHVSGQHVGNLVAFGLTFPVESQTFDFTSPTEHQPQQSVLFTPPPPQFQFFSTIPEQTGQYSTLNVHGHHWNLSASVTIPTPVPGLSLKTFLNFRNESPYDSGDRSAYAMTAPTVPGSGPFVNMGFRERDSETTRRGTWNAYVAQCNQCVASIPPGGLNTCDCPDALLIQDSERRCPNANGTCNDAYYSNLTDGRLPFEGNRGASGPFFDSGQTFNWWHFGNPQRGNIIQLAPGEPSFSLVGNTDPTVPSTSLGLGIGLHYGFEIVDMSLNISTQFDARDGFAVRESQGADPDSSLPGTIDSVGTWVDGEARAQINTEFAVSLNLPIIGQTTIIDKTFNLLDTTTRSNASAQADATSFSWTDAEPSSDVRFSIGGADTPISSCLNVPAFTDTPIPITDPRDFASSISQQMHDRIFPCNVRICNPSTHKLTVCDWSANKDNPACTDTTTTCTCADNNADMCDSTGHTYHGTDKPNSCSAVEQCGGQPLCNTDSDCHSASTLCFSGCCETVR